MITALWLTAFQISPAAAPVPSDEPGEEILITAALQPVPQSEAPASTTVIDEATIDALGLTLASDFVRLSPGVAVATSGARGTETVVRIRGAESNHTLVFIDGIAFNDVAAANAARFDTFTAGGLARIELIRGPQSALWGSEALGGVVAMSSPESLGEFRSAASIEVGNLDSRRAEAQIATGGDEFGLSATASWLRSDGIDILGGGTGDRDGFENVTLGTRAALRLGAIELGAAGRYIHHDIAFDGFDPLTFQRADTADVSAARTAALRGWISFGTESAGWFGRLEAQHLGSDNRNRVGDVKTTDSEGNRTRIGGQLGRQFALGATRHLIVGGIEREAEAFSLRDPNGSLVDHRLVRNRESAVLEWRAHWNDRLVTDFAVRHDDFSRFADDTSVRAQAVLDLSANVQLLAGYGEGIAQPSFTDLFGFPGFPFIGNPDLRPERSSGFEAGVRWHKSGFVLEAVTFSNNLQDEIVEDFSVFPGTVANETGKSRRRGVELSAQWRPTETMLLGANYTLLDAREGESGIREIRRPRHAANLFAQWRAGAVSAGASIAYVGRRLDRDFDLFPAPVVALADYTLASAQLAYQITSQLEAYGRIENGFDAGYQDVFGYNSQGRSVHAGLRFNFGR